MNLFNNTILLIISIIVLLCIYKYNKKVPLSENFLVGNVGKIFSAGNDERVRFSPSSNAGE